ncbi:tape measure protein [Capnocytophaga sputigena]|uniref:tape measure protein n=1 Tax=Capnocytophaga sputigena TaxID=1019 RepID=UPI0028ED1A38|nr:tape measure protein [Capnocytophaga sputigena]
MQPQDGALLFQVRADQSQIQKDVEAIKKQFEQMTNKAVEEGKKQANVWQTLLKGATAYFTLQGAQSFISQMVAVRSQFQQLEISFGTMLKSKEKANELMAQLTDLAAKTPFGLEEVSEGAKKLLAFQVPAEEVTETLRRMGDVASGLGVPMGQLIHVYGQVKAQGKLMTNDLYQFMNAGIPIIAELSKVVGKSETEIKDMVSAGKIGFTEIQAVIKNMTNEGGLFYNLMAEQSKSLGGQISNLRDNFDQMLNEIGKSSEGIVSGAIKGVSFLVENYETIGKLIAGLIVSYGTYRAALIATAAVQQVVAARTAGMTVAEMAHYTWLVLVEKAQKLLNLTMLANPYALAAAALVGLAVALWSLKDSTDANAEATERHNQLRKEQANLIDDEKNRISGLISTIQDETKSWNERNKAFLALRNSTDGVLNKYSTLNQMLREMSQVLKDINGRYETMNEKMSRDAVKKTNDLIKSKEEQIKKLEEEIKRTASSDRRTALRMDIANIRKGIEQDELLKQKQKREVVKNDVSNYESALSGKSLEQIQAEKKLIIEAYNLRKKQAKDSIANHSIAKIDSNNPYLKYDWNELGMFNEATERQIKLKQQEKVQTTDFIAKKEEILALQNKINEAESKNKNSRSVDNKDLSDLEAKKTKLKGLIDEYKQGTGIDLSQKNTPKSKATKPELPTFDTEKAQREHNRQIQDDLFAREEARIKIMQDGADKRFAIIQLEYDKQEEEIRRRSEDQLAAFIETEKQKAEAQGKWKKGQDFDTNTEAINAEKARLAENEKVLLADNAEYQRMQQEQVYKDLLEKYQTYTDQRKAIEEKYNADIAALQAKLGADAPQVKKAQDEKARELKKLDILYKKEGTAIAKLFDNLRKKTVKEIRQTITEAEAEIDELAKVLNMDDNANVEFITNLKQQLEQARDTADKSDTVFGKLGTNIKNLFKAKPNTAEWQEAFNGMLSSAQSITGQFGQLGDEFERLGQSTGNASLREFGKGIKEMGEIVNKAMSFAQIGGQIGQGWGAAIGGVIGAVYGFVQKIESDKERARQKERMWKQEQYQNEKRINELQDKRTLEGKNHSNSLTTNQIGKQLDIIKNYNDKVKKLRNDLIDVQNTQVFDRYEYKWGWYDGPWGIKVWGRYKDEVTKAFKDKVKPFVDNLGNIDYDFLESISEADSNRMSYGRDNIDYTSEQIKKAKDLYNQMKEFKKTISEYTSQTFGDLGGGFVNSIISAVEKGGNAFENFGQTVARVMKNIIKQTLVTEQIKEIFSKFQKEMDNIYASSLGLSNEQVYEKVKNKTIDFVNNVLKPEIQKGEQKAKAMFDALEQSGIKMYDDKQGRNAVEKGFARMSQDSADELNGQFRLLTQIGAETKNAMLQTANSIKELHQSMQINAAQQLRHLAGIEANTYQLHEVRKDIAGMKSILSNIETKGIKMLT